MTKTSQLNKGRDIILQNAEEGKIFQRLNLQSAAT
jgi:hypothetical protein